MPRVSVPLTRSTLLETQRALGFSREAHDLMDRKREILLDELRRVTPEAEHVREALLTNLSDAYEALSRARADIGSDQMARAALAAHCQPDVRITERSIVGAVVPIITCPIPDPRPSYSLAGTGVELDRAARDFAALLQMVCAAAQTEAAIVRLARIIHERPGRVARICQRG